MMHYKFIKAFFSQGHMRTLEIKKNIATSFVIKGVSIAVSFLLVPLTINYINPTQYGIWLTLSSIVAWFGLFDIGFANGLRNRFAEAKATGDYAKAKAYISTTYICLGIIFLFVWLLFFFINFFIDWTIVLNAPAQMLKELSLVAIIIFTFFCIQFILKTINTVLIADQKPAKAAFWDMMGQVLTLLIIYILTKTTSGSLLYLALTLGLAPILVLLCSSLWYYNNEYKTYKPSFHLFHKNIIKDILGLGIKFFFVQIAAIIIYQTNNIVITQVCGLQDVTVYNVAYKYFSIVYMVLMILIAPFWSAFTDAYTLQDTKWMKNVVQKLEMIWRILAGASIILLICSKWVYKIWIGNSVEIPFMLSLVVCIYILILMRFSIYIYLINGIGKIQLQLYFNIVLCLLNIPVTVLLGSKWGVSGVVLGSILISLPHIIWSPIQLKRILNGTAVGVWNK